MPSLPYDKKEVTITNCDREPIHLIGQSQDHGVILICDLEKLIVVQSSENVATHLKKPLEQVLNKPLKTVLSEKIAKSFQDRLITGSVLVPETIKVGEEKFFCIPSITGKHLLIDIEPYGKPLDALELQEQLTQIAGTLEDTDSINDMCQQAAVLVKKLFDYDRIMIYKFDEDWNGEVVAEVKEPYLESWLGLHYPATDIPKPAREIFLKQGVRIISDVAYKPSNIEPAISPISNDPVDLSVSELRAVSPIHIEYLKNMGVGASLTAALIVKGKLWGLIACHHNSAKFINYHQRKACEFLTQTFSNKLALKQTNIFLEKMNFSQDIREKLMMQLASIKSIPDALMLLDFKFTDLIDASGGALILDGEIHLTGKTPTIDQVTQLYQNFLKKEGHVYATRNLSKDYSPAQYFKKEASGLLSTRIGKQENNYLIWFRPESKETVSWGGNPEKQGFIKDGVEYLSPRKSFERWTENLDGIAKSWQEYDFQAVKNLQESLTHNMVKRQKEEIDQLNSQLTEANKELEAFSYIVSHDLRAPLRGIDGYARILNDQYLSSLDDYSQKAIKTILRSATEMDRLIDDILSYSRVGQTQLKLQNIGMGKLIEDALNAQNVSHNYPNTVVEVQEGIPNAEGDRRMVYQLINNLINNAFKYSSKVNNPKVSIGFFTEEGKTVYYIRDNGIGFDTKFTDKIFGVFSRLMTDEYPGSGIGLSIVKKVIDKHDGKIWVDSKPGEGTIFQFTLPLHT